MSDLNIRNVPEPLIRALKMEAAEVNKTLRDVCIDRLGFAFHRHEEKKAPRLKLDAVSGKGKVAIAQPALPDNRVPHPPGCPCFVCGQKRTK